MSLYSDRLARLKEEFNEIKKRRGKKKFPDNQQAIYDFVHGHTKKAVLSVGKIRIELQRGNDFFGLQHILIKHYCERCPGRVEGKHILYLDEMVSGGIKWDGGVTNEKNIVYKKIKGDGHHLLVLKPTKNKKYVVSLYREE